MLGTKLGGNICKTWGKGELMRLECDERRAPMELHERGGCGQPDPQKKRGENEEKSYENGTQKHPRKD